MASQVVAWADMPAELVAHVLQHIPMEERLKQSALVSKTWSRAAAAATDAVERNLPANAVPAFQQFFHAHGTQLHTLKLPAVNKAHRRSLQLPCSALTALQVLHLPNWTLQLPDFTVHDHAAGQRTSSSMQEISSSMGEVPEALFPSLVELDLQSSTLPDAAALLRLAQAPQLTHLNLKYVNYAGFKESSWDGIKDPVMLQQLHAVITDLLQQLPRLFVLDLEGAELCPAAVQHMAAMTRLQDLSMTLSSGVASCLQALPASFTRLYVTEHTPEAMDNGQPSMPPELQQLTALQHLHLQFCAVQPRLLASITQLQQLFLQCCSLLPDGPVDADADLPSAGAAGLLAVLPRLSKLQHLQLEIPGFDFVDIPDLQAFSALTSSPKLEALIMPNQAGQPFPKGAAEHIFSADMQLTQLQCVDISNSDSARAHEFCLDAADLKRIVTCCPSLQQLNITGALEPGADVSVLLQLPTSCSELHVGGPAFTDTAAPLLAQLTQLRQLSWTDSPGITDLGIKQLTALRRLNTLFLMECAGLSEAVLPKNKHEAGGVSYQTAWINLETSRAEGPVWLQLAQRCARSRATAVQQDAGAAAAADAAE